MKYSITENRLNRVFNSYMDFEFDLTYDHNFDEFTTECFVIFDGEVSVFSKIYGYVQEAEDKYVLKE